MAITQVGTTVEQGITYGLSKWCDELFSDGDWKASELARFSWCRWEDKYMDCVSATDINVTTAQGAAVESMLSYFQSDGVRNKTKYVDNRIEGKPYYFNILMYGRNNDLCLTSDNAANYRVVTSCSDFQKLYVKVDEYYDVSDWNVQYPTARTIKENTLLWTTSGVYNTDNDSYTEWITVWTVLVIDENTFFVTRGMAFPGRTPGLYDGVIGSAQNNIRPSNYITVYNDSSFDTWYYHYGDITTYNKSKHLLRWYRNGLNIPDVITWTTNYESACWDVDSNVSVFMYGSVRTSSRAEYKYTYYLRTEEAVKNAIAYTGLRWRYQNGDTEHIYTPIIDGDGYITGYSTDPEAETKLNDITDVTGNNISPLPPTPPPPSSDDDYESMTTGFASTLSGCTKYYLMSPLDIVTLIRDYYTHAFAGSTLSNSIISCYLCGLSPAEFISTETPAPIKIPTVAGEQIFESVNSYKAIDAVVNKIQVGNIAVPRMNNDFHDFSPYTIYEVFIPYCGWISLPDTVAGKHIYVEFHVDVRTMAGKAIVLIGADDGGKATCAEMSMNIGASTPFAVIEAGLERQAAVTAGIQTAIGTAAAITGINSGHNALTVSSIGTAAQGIANGMMSSMANYTQVQGKAGDTSDFANGRQCYLKISWAKTDEVVNNSRFGHTVGYLCNTVGKIKEFKGLTVCANPHVNGIDCTDSEKEEIKRLLEEGIIVN